MPIRITQVDAFTNRRYSGNPAAVCVLSEPTDERWMQDVAAEMNLSETAYATRLPGGSKFNLRWFTPKSEVDLCGHATLATAHVLWEDGHLPRDEPARRLHAVEHGHADVHQDDIRPATLGERHRLGAVLGFPDDLDLGSGSEDGPEPGAHERLVVADQDPDAHGLVSSSGSRARTS